MVVLDEFVVEFVQHPLDMSKIFDETKTLLLDCIENISLSESCLNESWTDLTKGQRTHAKQKSSSFPRMLFLHRKIFCHWAIFCCSMVRSERAFFNRPHSFKHAALLTRMRYVNRRKFRSETSDNMDS